MEHFKTSSDGFAIKMPVTAITISVRWGRENYATAGQTAEVAVFVDGHSRAVPIPKGLGGSDDGKVAGWASPRTVVDIMTWASKLSRLGAEQLIATHNPEG